MNPPRFLSAKPNERPFAHARPSVRLLVSFRVLLLMPKSFYIIDGHAQIFRAFFAPFRDLTSPTGEPTKAVHVFCSMLFNLIKQRKPDYLAMAMDVSDKSVFRTKLYPEYKANRDETPESLHSQADRIVTIVEALRIPIFRVSGFEADDVMATIASQLDGGDVDLYLVSRDKDLDQLITERVRLYDPVKNEVIDAAGVLASKGFTPDKAVEVQILIGDTTDNIPGVVGVGPKTAAKLINQYGSADAVLEHADEQTPKLKESLKKFAAQLPITRELVTLRRDVPLSFELAHCDMARLQPAAALPIFNELGFKSLKDQLLALGGAAGANAGATAASTEKSKGGEAAATLFDAIPERKQAKPSDYRLVDSMEEFDRFFAELTKQPRFAFDTETTGINPVAADIVGMSFSWESNVGYYLPLRSSMGKVLPLDKVVAKLKPIMEDNTVHKIGQNIKYDSLVLKQIGINVAGVSFDTMIASSLLDPMRNSHSIDSLAKSLTGHDMIPITDLIGKGKDQLTMDQIDTQRVCEYAAEDADYTWQVYEVFEPRIRGSHFEPLFNEVEMPLVEVLTDMENNGIAIDTDLLKKLSGQMADRMMELSKEVHKAAGHTFNIDSTKQLATVLFDEQGLQVVRKTKTGRSTDAETLEELAETSENPIPRLVLEYRELAKLKGTYVDTLPTMICRRTGRIHANFKQSGAITGRLSSSDPNLQNIPIRTSTGKQIREAFVAQSKDDVLLTADYSQIELRLLAHFCEDENLIAAFNAGLDIHRAVAAEVNGVSPDEVTSAQRSAAKAVNFGIIYGQSAFGLSRALDISQTEAKQFIERYFQRYPGIRAFIDRCISEAKRTGYAETILGRRRPIAELQSSNRAQMLFGERIAVNTVVQGSAADLIKKAMVDIHRELKTGRYSARLLIQVHDELVFEVAKKSVEAEAAMIRDKMQNAMSLRVPIGVDVGTGRTWAEGK